jgi:hypothetical protein
MSRDILIDQYILDIGALQEELDKHARYIIRLRLHYLSRHLAS